MTTCKCWQIMLIHKLDGSFFNAGNTFSTCWIWIILLHNKLSSSNLNKQTHFPSVQNWHNAVVFWIQNFLLSIKFCSCSSHTNNTWKVKISDYSALKSNAEAQQLHVQYKHENERSTLTELFLLNFSYKYERLFPLHVSSAKLQIGIAWWCKIFSIWLPG